MDNRYIFADINNNSVRFVGQEAQHISRVRRAKIGEEIVGINGDGYDYHLKIDEVTNNYVNAQILAKNINKAYQSENITVYLAMIKNDALTEAIDHLAELNVKHVKLFFADRSIANIDQKKLSKLNAIAIQASKQCERADFMDISIIKKSDIKQDSAKIPNCFFAYEDASSTQYSLTGDFAVIIGPEGGFSTSEVEYFSSFAKTISLGKTILRAEVASVVAVSSLKAVNNAR